MSEIIKDDHFGKLPDEVSMNCPVCGAKAELWENYRGENTFKAVMCSNGEGFAGLERCLLYMPPAPFYRATRREAKEFWKNFCIEMAHRP